MKIDIIYGSDGGNTSDIAELVASKIDGETNVIDVANAKEEDFTGADVLILGSSTWGEGDLQDDWDSFIEEFASYDLGGKKVALFGLGDQEGYGDSFVGAMGTIYEIAKATGATIIGDGVSTDGYEFEESTAIVDGKFVGLPIDEDNQGELTDQRVSAWVEKLQTQLSA